MKPSAALAAAALFAWQPMPWGHAFINPKDPPFMTFFLAAVCLGFEMVDRVTEPGGKNPLKVILPAILLGITTSIRVLGPLAGVLVFLYFLYAVFTSRNLRVPVSPWLLFFGYGFITLLSMFLTWPYLWEEPLSRFLEVFRLMSDNPTSLSVLFGGEVFRAGDLPRRYLPFMLAVTLTEPVWILFALGGIAGYGKLAPDRSLPELEIGDRHPRLLCSGTGCLHIYRQPARRKAPPFWLSPPYFPYGLNSILRKPFICYPRNLLLPFRVFSSSPPRKKF